MAISVRVLLLIVLMGAALLYQGLQPLIGCGPWLPVAYFTFARHPSDPRYFDGDLGILQPTYWRIYLYTAYRYLTESDLKPVATSPPAASRLEKPTNWAETWLSARKKVKPEGAAPQIAVFRELPPYQSYLNYPDDAFRNAVETLESRVTQFGAESKAVHDWLEAQDLVFSNHSVEKHIPAAASKDLPLLIQRDRDYQIAAATFYAEEFDDAERRFRAIAHDLDSPWRTWAPYLAARCLVRKAALKGGDGQWDLESLSRRNG